MKVFTVEEVKKLVVNAYEVGFCDGSESISYDNEDFKVYKNATEFWEKNQLDWLTKEINYSLNYKLLIMLISDIFVWRSDT